MAAKGEPNEDNVIIGAAIRAIRTDRRMRSSEVARAMDIALRTYGHLEEGRASVTQEVLTKFAKVTNCDVFALMACVPLRDPLFALHCADNKIVGIMVMALAELHEKLGIDIALIDTKTVVGAVTRVCRELEDHIQKRDLFAERWVSEKSAKYNGLPLASLRRRPKKI